MFVSLSSPTHLNGPEEETAVSREGVATSALLLRCLPDGLRPFSWRFGFGSFHQLVLFSCYLFCLVRLRRSLPERVFLAYFASCAECDVKRFCNHVPEEQGFGKSHHLQVRLFDMWLEMPTFHSLSRLLKSAIGILSPFTSS